MKPLVSMYFRSACRPAFVSLSTFRILRQAPSLRSPNFITRHLCAVPVLSRSRTSFQSAGTTITATPVIAATMNGNKKTKASSTDLPSPIVVIGASGKMGGAIINGIVSAIETPPRIIGTGRDVGRMAHLSIPDADKVTDNVQAVKQASVVVISVKPNVAAGVFQQIASALDNQSTKNKPIIVSVVAGLTLSAMRKLLKKHPSIPIIRTMPNTPVAVNAGCTAMCWDDATPQASVDVAAQILQCIGDVERIDEKVMDAATGIAGCGVAYLFMAAEAMADAGVKHGLKRDVAMRMAASTVFGAGALLKQGKHPAILRNEVESPGGVTIMATSALEEEGFRSAIGTAVDAVVEKLEEMEEEDD